MKREKNTLIFEPDEEEKFFRVIRLYGLFKKRNKQDIGETIKHEKDHLSEIKELGYEKFIDYYQIKVDEEGAHCRIKMKPFNFMSKEEIIKIALAPTNPSTGDYNLIGNFGGRN